MLRVSRRTGAVYKELLASGSRHASTPVALALGGLLSKAYVDFDAVVLASRAGLTEPATALARILIESAINIFYLTSLAADEQDSECLRFIMHREVDLVRYRLVQERIGQMRESREPTTPRDLDFRVAAVQHLQSEIRSADPNNPGLSILAEWETKGLPGSWSGRNLLERLETVVADQTPLANLVIAYRLCYSSFSGAVHGPSALGQITRVSSLPDGTSVRIGFSRTTSSGHSSPLVTSVLLSVDLMERYSDAMQSGVQRSIDALRSVAVRVIRDLDVA